MSAPPLIADVEAREVASGTVLPLRGFLELGAEGDGQMSELGPTPELPDDTPISKVHLPSRIKDALFAAGLKTVGEVRERSDQALLGLPDIGNAAVYHLRGKLGLPSSVGVRPSNKTTESRGAAALLGRWCDILGRGCKTGSRFNLQPEHQA
jgi:hypothetical protein